ARARRKALAAEAEFYGAMDGASRFTQRDAIASILITAINIVAGFLIGVLQHGMDLQRALQTYTVLTIGDGLVTVIPALMISVCGGLIVTRASSDSKLGADVRLQIFSKSQPLLLAGGVLLAMALFPGLPKIPFIVLGAGAGYAGWTLRTAEAKKSKAPAQTKQAKAAENLENLLKVEAVAIEVGLGLVRMVEGGQNSLLLSRISMIRKQLASEVGYLLPPVRVTDNLQLKAREYIISIKGLEVARYELQAGCEMAIQPAQPAAVLPTGVTTKEPAFNMPAVWINPDQVEKAKQLGYTVVDPVSVVGTHFTEVIRKYAAELLTRQETKRILDRVGQDNGKLIEDLVPKQISLATVQKVLQNLLRERISIRDVVTILEALGEAASLTKNVVLMTEFVRQSIKRSIVRPLLSGSDLTVYFVDNEIEKKIEGATEHGEYSSHLNLPPQEIRLIMDKFQRVFTATQSNSVVLSSASCRYFLRQVLENSLPALSIISHNELPPGVRVVSLGTVK
ncbi:MAG: flagellar biosynthesis protein FlhA, partial [Bryobacteraceae bacterium]